MKDTFWLGVDTGGTFTDFVLYDGRGLYTGKVLSTPAAPERAIIDGSRRLCATGPPGRIIHGSTVATNAVLEGKGVRTAYVTNRGMADVLTIGRQARKSLYDLQPPPEPAPVDPALCIETGGRVSATGDVLDSLTEPDRQALRRQLRALAPEAVAINLLFSFLNDAPEREIEALMPDGVFITRSSAVLPESREYERGVATWLSAYVGPLLEGYLERLGRALDPAPVSVLQSSGVTVDARGAGRAGVHLLLSGPAGGLIGAQWVAKSAGIGKLLTLDMGGTSTDVAMVDGEPRLTTEGRVGRFPVAVPMVDIHTIGAGGGSIARLDPGGMLIVGPESAGADPGPACYGRTGRAPTVTDAHVVLGHIPADRRLAGTMPLDVEAAREAIGGIAREMGAPLEQVARGIIRIANEHMAAALRVISVQRGIDPREYVLTSFGGAGGLHVCALADTLGMNNALVPVYGGVLSALGMLVAPPGRELSRAFTAILARASEPELESSFASLAEAGMGELVTEGIPRRSVRILPSLDLRYLGQSYTLRIPWYGIQRSERAFKELHEERYGHRMDVPVQIVNTRVSLRSDPPNIMLPEIDPPAPGIQPRHMPVSGIAGKVAVWERHALGSGQSISGPALIAESEATTYLAENWRCEVDRFGNLLLSR